MDTSINEQILEALWNLGVAGYFVTVTNVLGLHERVNVQHIIWVYYDDGTDQTVVRFTNGGTRHYKGNVVVALTQDCIVHAA